MANVLSALRPPVAVLRHCTGCVNSCPLPTWVMTSVAGPLGGRPKPAAVSVRSRCFIETVSPARSSTRSNTVWARWSGRGSLLVGTLKRHGSMPRCHDDQVKAMSCAPWLSARALTK